MASGGWRGDRRATAVNAGRVIGGEKFSGPRQKQCLSLPLQPSLSSSLPLLQRCGKASIPVPFPVYPRTLLSFLFVPFVLVLLSVIVNFLFFLEAHFIHNGCHGQTCGLWVHHRTQRSPALLQIRFRWCRLLFHHSRCPHPCRCVSRILSSGIFLPPLNSFPNTLPLLASRPGSSLIPSPTTVVCLVASSRSLPTRVLALSSPVSAPLPPVTSSKVPSSSVATSCSSSSSSTSLATRPPATTVPLSTSPRLPSLNSSLILLSALSRPPVSVLSPSLPSLPVC